MQPTAEIIAVIPARGGSKGIPGKNIKLLAGRPLIAYSIEAARSALCVKRVIVSTDDQRIAEVAKQQGAEVPFLRPSELAQDHTPGIAPIHHAVTWLRENEHYLPDCVVMLQPTSPFRPASLVDRAINIMRETHCDYLLSLAPVKQHPYWMKTIASGGVRPFLDIGEAPARRQDLPPAYAISGSLYAWTLKALLRRDLGTCSGATQFLDERVGAVMVDGIYALDIDTHLDFKFAEIIAHERTAEVGAA